MNYRHHFHAGNFADVFKHVFLARILDYLVRKDSAIRYLDTHSGIARYDLRADKAVRGGEWRDGVGRLSEVAWSPEEARLLEPYFKALGPFGKAREMSIYPGSPAIAQTLLRTKDRLTLCELHREDFRALVTTLGRDRRIKAIEIDGYVALRAYTPPAERRGCVLIDPPFESPDEFNLMRDGLRSAYEKWPTGVYVLWYPLKDANAVRAFCAGLASDGVKRVLRLELTTEAVRPQGALTGCGLLIVNPPYVLADEAQVLAPTLARVLAKGAGSSWLVEQAIE